MLIHKVYHKLDQIELNHKQDPLLSSNPFIITSGNSTINVYEPSHGRTTGDVVVFRNVDGSPGGLAFTLFVKFIRI